MARPRKQYRVFKHKRKDKKTKKTIESANYYILFKDHLQIERKLKGTSDKSATERMAGNVIAIVNHRATNQKLIKELLEFIENQPRQLRDSLLEWGILDKSTYSGFEHLMIFNRVRAKNSKRLRLNITGGHVFD